MPKGIGSLYEILKDKTRRTIILKLNEKGSIGYTELIDITKASSTGKLNYHLKILGDLVTKNSNGQYMLSEKGKLASKMLIEFPDDTASLYKEWIRINLMSKRTDWLFGVKLSWILSLISLTIVIILNAVSINNLIFAWLFFTTGVYYLLRYFKDKSKNHRP
jgi:hypothetical protein